LRPVKVSQPIVSFSFFQSGSQFSSGSSVCYGASTCRRRRRRSRRHRSSLRARRRRFRKPPANRVNVGSVLRSEVDFIHQFQQQFTEKKKHFTKQF
jgi:hypothetical protein